MTTSERKVPELQKWKNLHYEESAEIEELKEGRDQLGLAIYKNLSDPYSSESLEGLRLSMEKQYGKKWDEVFKSESSTTRRRTER